MTPFRLPASAVAAAVLLAVLSTPAAYAQEVTVENDVVYKTVNGTPLHMDIARPASADRPLPVIVMVHGGGWAGGNKNGYRPAIKNFAKAGYVAVTVQYRLVPAGTFPNAVEDVRCAVRYLRSRAKELNIDPQRFGAMGHSAGGHLSLILGTVEDDAGLEGPGYEGHSGKVQAVVNFFGPTDLAQPYEPNIQPLLTGFIGGTPDVKPSETRLASPIAHLSKNDGPILTFHGTNDNVVPYSQATILDAACKKIGVEHELDTIEGGGHGFAGAEGMRTLLKSLEFFNKHLKG